MAWMKAPEHGPGGLFRALSAPHPVLFLEPSNHSEAASCSPAFYTLLAHSARNTSPPPSPSPSLEFTSAKPPGFVRGHLLGGPPCPTLLPPPFSYTGSTPNVITPAFALTGSLCFQKE